MEHQINKTNLQIQNLKEYYNKNEKHFFTQSPAHTLFKELVNEIEKEREYFYKRIEELRNQNGSISSIINQNYNTVNIVNEGFLHLNTESIKIANQLANFIRNENLKLQSDLSNQLKKLLQEDEEQEDDDDKNDDESSEISSSSDIERNKMVTYKTITNGNVGTTSNIKNIIPWHKDKSDIRISYYSNSQNYYQALKSHFSIKSMNEKNKIILETDNEYYLPNQNISDCKFNDITLYVMFGAGSRVNYDSFKKDLEELSEKTNVILTLILGGSNAIPIIIDEYKGHKIQFNFFKSIIDTETSKESTTSFFNILDSIYNNNKKK